LPAPPPTEETFEALWKVVKMAVLSHWCSEPGEYRKAISRIIRYDEALTEAQRRQKALNKVRQALRVWVRRGGVP
jgi:hypothetical protein